MKIIILLSVLLAGCILNKNQAEKALKDPITLNLVKQSVMDEWFPNIAMDGGEGKVVYYNGCSVISRGLTNLELISDRPISCDALDLRLKKLGYSVSSSSLVSYYRDRLEKQKNEQQKQIGNNRKKALQQQIENMANGRQTGNDSD